MSRQGLLGLFCVKLYAICIACTDIVSSISSLFHPLHFLHKIKARQASLAFWKKCVSNFMYPNCNRYFQLISSVTSYFAQILTTTQLLFFKAQNSRTCTFKLYYVTVGWIALFRFDSFFDTHQFSRPIVPRVMSITSKLPVELYLFQRFNIDITQFQFCLQTWRVTIRSIPTWAVPPTTSRLAYFRPRPRKPLESPLVPPPQPPPPSTTAVAVVNLRWRSIRPPCPLPLRHHLLTPHSRRPWQPLELTSILISLTRLVSKFW